jgi:hypothetical protein
MAAPKTYLAASVPRYLRQTRLGYLPLHSLIGVRVIRNLAGVASQIFDVIMLSQGEFQRMRMNVSLQHIASPALKMGGGIDAVFVLTDTKQVVVQADDPNPMATARKFLVQEFAKDPSFMPLPPRTSSQPNSPADAASDAPFWPLEP